MKRICRLDSLRVAMPCPVPWSSMAGDERIRFCDRCRKNVYNVAALSPAEALALVRALFILVRPKPFVTMGAMVVRR